MTTVHSRMDIGLHRARVAGWIFRAYKTLLSPALHGGAIAQCRHLPTCSEYAYVAVVRHGWVRGSFLAAKRLARCHPLGKGGFDPVPR